MSQTSKFIERFDIDPSDANFLELMIPPSPKFYSCSAPESVNSLHSNNSITSTKAMPMPKQRNTKNISLTPPSSPPKTSEKQHDAFASRLKHFISSISKKRDSSPPVTSSITPITTK